MRSELFLNLISETINVFRIFFILFVSNRTICSNDSQIKLSVSMKVIDK